MRAPTSGRRSGLVALLRRPTFRRLFVAHAISRAGDAFNTVALVVLVFDLTGSGLGVAGTVVFEVVPVLLFSPVAGLIVDRLARRRVMVAADVARAVLAAVLVFVSGSVVVAYLVAFGLATGALLFNPAAASLIPDTVGDDQLVDANAAMWTVAVVAQILLAPTAGLVITAFGVEVAFAINAASYVASALLLHRLDTGERPAATGTTATWSAIAAGLHVVRAHPLLARLAVVQVLAALSAGATSGLLVVLANEWLGVGASGFGLLLAAIGIGAATGPLVLRRWIRPASRPWLFTPYALRGGVDLSLASVADPYLAGGALFLYGTATSTGTIAYNATLQTQVPADTRGRAFALYDLVWNAARLTSLGLGGVLAETLGIRSVYLISGLLLLLAAGYGSLRPLRVVTR